MSAMNREDLLKSLIREAIILIKDEKIKKHIKNKYQEIINLNYNEKKKGDEINEM